MQLLTLAYVATFSISIGVLIGAIRLRRIDSQYTPFIILLFIGLTNELVSLYRIRYYGNNVLNYNIYNLSEVLLILYLFNRWKLFKSHHYYLVLITLFTSGWLLEGVIRHFSDFNSYFIVLSSLAVAILSIEMLLKLIYRETYRLYRNAKFIICSGFLLYFTYSMLMETFWIFNINTVPDFNQKLFDILNYINLITNLSFAIALLCAPLKPRYILES